VDVRSDLFSAAVVLQEMLIGERPFPGRNLTEIACRLLRDPPTGGDEVRAVAGSAVSSVIQRALEKAPGDRYASASVMADALRAAIGQAVPQSSPTQTIDRTVVAVRARGLSPPSPAANTFDPVLLSKIERRLANRIGPIARYLVHTSLPAAASVEALCDSLAQRIDRPDDRRQFLSEAMEAIRSGATAGTSVGSNPPQSQFQSEAPTPSVIPPEEIERTRRALAETLGPIAKVLVQRALRQAQNPQELWGLLSVHIGTAVERANFLAQRDKGNRSG
jgi:serine/threonine protein kinase